MLLKEIANPNQSTRKALNNIDSVNHRKENSIVDRKKEKKRMKPMPNNIKHSLLHCLMTTLDE